MLREETRGNWVPSRSRNRLLTKIYSSTGVRGSGTRGFAHSGVGGKHVDVVVLGIANADLMTSTCAANLFAVSDVEEGTTKQDFEGSVLYDLDLEVDGDGAQLDRMVLDES